MSHLILFSFGEHRRIGRYSPPTRAAAVYWKTARKQSAGEPGRFPCPRKPGQEKLLGATCVAWACRMGMRDLVFPWIPHSPEALAT